MRRFLLSLSLLVLASPVFAADCINNAPFTVFGSVVCQQAASFPGSSTNVDHNQVSFSATAGRSLVVEGYMCVNTTCADPPDWQSAHSYSANDKIRPRSNNPCGYTFIALVGFTSGGLPPASWSTTPCKSSPQTKTDNAHTWSLMYLFPGDNTETLISCFDWSPNSPGYLQSASNGNAYPNWIYYCPSAPSGITAISLVCGVGASTGAKCSYISVFVQEYTGMCGTAPCFDPTDGIGNGTGTSMTATTGSLAYSNELVIGIAGENNDEAITAGSGCVQLDEQFTGNEIMAKQSSGGGGQTCTATFSPSDNWGIMISGIKSAASASLSVPQPLWFGR